MSSNRLDLVNTFDQFGHDHWKALGTKLGGVEVVKAILRETAKVTVDCYLEHIASITVGPTHKGVTIARAKDVFASYFDTNFRNPDTDVPGTDTEAQVVNVHAMKSDGTFPQLFKSLGDPRSLCLTQGQIVEFCRTHKDQMLQSGYSTLFLFEVKGKLLVVNACVIDGGLHANVIGFGSSNVWEAGRHYRAVVKRK